ncbi:methylmalonyl Co-A mutase-associated GTPase MeaB [Psychroserpens sp.]|uniref:methylmalonyl Co-A mutase-associated GTPase MeaB n=1 Tax=Psychroserpens sp. TaxID=2020870 RepID=UPI001B106714|nr:methylmalonyl Co-A mutase-associated GTPase MeaB [Psychroserpens sp.]MBO6606924.1 methylmalonyl Co-A mutase-associated GTPase MeaB [Psychroserpens sp.]MBO6631710.1 methylmalonyl Co-A mutase-associated GTPase MeaB [Psychroserpens sp.]MBO6654070.1 methylmalonyl Co-A mutase-associated GTPase MeaB [Psychroserpens sp.]MBO6682644.1 methylmalonyl Co-A mutase-associated GTPase MeaB [Psychroserpens sp.]MBO6750696.1 methylmalonyl Co-A mutase-associated GTPase MeaB [Psychroserpens sp.]
MSKQQKPSALHEKDGVSESEITNEASIQSIKHKRRVQPSTDELVSEILKGNITALSRAITLIESSNPTHLEKANAIIKMCLPHANNSVRIGITGVPGVGKSTFIEAFGLHLTEIGKKVAVLAVDPSSSLSKGSILGDKTRMEDLVKDENAFIRPSPSGTSLGGVARKTRETIILCEAAGFDTIIIETVGVGQSETAVHSMVDFFLLLKIAGAGDELQGIKRGIIEMADAIAINKADGDNLKSAKLAKVEFNRALHLYPQKDSEWQPKVTLCSALKREGISDLWALITNYLEHTKANNYFESNRTNQNKFWLLQTIEERLKSDFFNQPKIKEALEDQLQLIEEGKTTPFVAAEYLLNLS